MDTLAVEPKRSWEEIKRLYPDEWVLLVDPEEDEITRVTAGKVLEHSRDHAYIRKRLVEVRGHKAILYTGKPKGGVVARMGFVRIERDP